MHPARKKSYPHAEEANKQTNKREKKQQIKLHVLVMAPFICLFPTLREKWTESKETNQSDKSEHRAHPIVCEIPCCLFNISARIYIRFVQRIKRIHQSVGVHFLHSFISSDLLKQPLKTELVACSCSCMCKLYSMLLFFYIEIRNVRTCSERYNTNAICSIFYIEQ